MKTHGHKRRHRRSRGNSGKLLVILLVSTLAVLGICVIVLFATGKLGKTGGEETEALSEQELVNETSVAIETVDHEVSADPVPVKTAGAMTGLSASEEKTTDSGKKPADGTADAQTEEIPQPDGVVVSTLITPVQPQEEQGEGTATDGEPGQETGEAPAEGGEEGAAQADPAVPAYTPEEEAAIASYYSNTVLAGDSVMLGFRNYCRSGDAVMQGLNFLVAGSYSLHNAFWPVGGDSVHPLYQGQQRLLWESIQMIGPNRVFLFFGINDMVYGIDDTVAKYKELIDMIKSVTPDVQIVIISTTYTLAGQGKKNLNNTNIAQFNQIMAAEAAANGWGYIDIATPTSDGNGNLLPAYCSDGYLHQSRSAYVVWENTFKEYALRQSGLR